MHGRGEMQMTDGRKLVGRWMEGSLQGKGLVLHADKTEDEVIWRDGVILPQVQKVVSEGRTWSCSIMCNVAMVAVGVGCGVGAILTKD